MNKLTTLIILSFCTLLVRAQNKVSVHATIPGLKAGQWVYLDSLTSIMETDSAQTTADGFTIGIHIPNGEGDAYVLKLGKQYTANSMMIIYLDKGNVEIKGAGPLFKDAKVSGTASVRDYEDYNNSSSNDPILKQRKELYKKARELDAKNDSVGLAALEPELNRIDSADKALTKEWIKRHPASPIGAFLLSYKLSRLEPEEKTAILAQLTPAARDNAPAKRVANSIKVYDLTGIGKTAMDFTQNDTLGNPVSLKDFRGKYVLVDFWASWCVPCRAENPNVVAAWKKYKDKNFTVLSVSLDQPNGKEKWLNAIHADHLEWTHVSDLKYWNNAVAKQYDINSIPTNLLLDPEGKIVAKNLHGEELSKELAKLLN